MNQRSLIAIIILAGIGSIGSVLAYSGTISAGQGNFNNVLVTGTCTGCGGGEGSFTNYSSIVEETNPFSGSSSPCQVNIDNNGTAFVLESCNQGNAYSIDSLGNISLLTNTGTALNNYPYIPQNSINGLYKLVGNKTNTILIYKSNTYLTKLTLDLSVDFSSMSNLEDSISPNGKYIVVYGTNQTFTGNTVQIFRGS